MNPLESAGMFLIQTLVDLYLMVLLLRFLLQYLRADYYNPLSQFILKATNPLVIPLRRKIPGYWGMDFATLILIVGSILIKMLLLSLLVYHKLPTVGGLILLSTGELSTLFINLFFYAILFRVLISWLAPHANHPICTILFLLTEPLMSRARRYIPLIGGNIDISPILVLIGLKLLTILITHPLLNMGWMLAIR